MHRGPNYLVKWTESTRRLFEPLGVYRGQCCSSQFFFVKLIGQVTFGIDNFPLKNGPDVINKRGAIRYRLTVKNSLTR